MTLHQNYNHDGRKSKEPFFFFSNTGYCYTENKSEVFSNKNSFKRNTSHEDRFISIDQFPLLRARLKVVWAFSKYFSKDRAIGYFLIIDT